MNTCPSASPVTIKCLVFVLLHLNRTGMSKGLVKEMASEQVLDELISYYKNILASHTDLLTCQVHKILVKY